MAFQVIPSPENPVSNAIDAYARISEISLARQRAATENQIAQANMQSLALQNQLLSQYGGPIKQAELANLQRQVPESEQRVATEQSQQKYYEAETANIPIKGQQMAQELDLMREQLKEQREMFPIHKELGELSIDTGYSNLQTQALEQHGMQTRNLLQDFTLDDARSFKSLAKQTALDSGIHPFTANQISGPQGLHMVLSAKQDQEQIKALQADTALKQVQMANDKLIGPAQTMNFYASAAEKFASWDKETLDHVVATAPTEIQPIVQFLGEMGAAGMKGTAGLIQRGMNNADTFVQEKALQVQALMGDLKAPGGMQLGPDGKMIYVPSGVDRLKPALDDLAKALNKGTKSKGAASTQPSEEEDTGTPSAEQSLNEELMKKQVTKSVNNRFDALDERVAPEGPSFGADTGPRFGSTETPATPYESQLPKVKDVQKEVTSDLKNSLPPGQFKRVNAVLSKLPETTDPSKRARLFEAMRQMTQTQRPQLVIDTLEKKYGSSTFAPEDAPFIQAIEQIMGWPVKKGS